MPDVGTRPGDEELSVRIFFAEPPLEEGVANHGEEIGAKCRDRRFHICLLSKLPGRAACQGQRQAAGQI
jgi:hypothetical protein